MSRDVSEPKLLFSSKAVPLLQNRVYDDEVSARSAATGELEIVYDNATQFALNLCFDESILLYDCHYDNAVPSRVFSEYYREIGFHLDNTYAISRGRILDIGCGEGTFLCGLANQFPLLSGMGVDPAYRGDAVRFGGRLQFTSEYFSEDVLGGYRPDVIVCRHTLEHISRPAAFLSELTGSLPADMQDTPIFVEVPDLEWILANGAFWDFCYEHVNYFTKASLQLCFEAAGIEVESVRTAFGGQYLWAQGRVGGGPKQVDSFTARARCDSSRFAEGAVGVENKLEQLLTELQHLAQGRKLVVWGMATKGVMYTIHLGRMGAVFDYCVDVNVRKQGKFVPVSGQRIVSPDQMSEKEQYAIICMNPNYISEIKSMCNSRQLCAEFFTPFAERIS